ncbi:hypothetical protein Scep_004396 [Stephania cephalantha]|uniref:Uncharacterized protein n=1 Tax=Stephania cephalantha TaxID=152367 RepID=A0AAP0PVB9_9MAGN
MSFDWLSEWVRSDEVPSAWRPILEDPSNLQIFFYYYAIAKPPISKEAASGTKGGSSGSPVIDWQGQAVALNAGSKSSSASAFILPLERHKPILHSKHRSHGLSRHKHDFHGGHYLHLQSLACTNLPSRLVILYGLYSYVYNLAVRANEYTQECTLLPRLLELVVKSSLSQLHVASRFLPKRHCHVTITTSHNVPTILLSSKQLGTRIRSLAFKYITAASSSNLVPPRFRCYFVAN